VDHDIFTRVFGPGEVVLGGNQSGGAEGAESMYVLFSAPSSSPPDPLGSLETTASTTGEDQDTDGYTVTVDGDFSMEIGPNDSATFSGLNEGDHQVELSGLRANCSVDGQNPRSVSVTTGKTASTSYSVSCTSTTGSLKASASTTGEDQDTDGYAVTVGGSTSKEIDPNGSATFSGLNEGNHQVELTGLKANCSVGGPNPRTVSVTAGNAASTSFSVSCTSSGGGGGDLQAVEIPNQSDFTDRGKILDGGACGEWDWWPQGPSSVVHHEGTTYLYYVGMRGDRSNNPGDPINDCSTEDGDEANRFLGVATSTDNRTFSKSSANPIVEHQPNGGAESGLSGEGGVLEGASPGVINGDFRIYLSGLEEHDFEDVNTDIVYLESEDGINFGNQSDAIQNASTHPVNMTPSCEELYVKGAVKMGATYHLYMSFQGGKCNSANERVLYHFESSNPTDFGTNPTKVSAGGNDIVAKGGMGDAIQIDENTIFFISQDDYGVAPIGVWTAAKSSPASFTKHATWDWGPQVSEPKLYLDRENEEWLLFYRYMPDGGSTGNNEIHLKTAPVQYAN
jgi:hypothetical protein